MNLIKMGGIPLTIFYQTVIQVFLISCIETVIGRGYQQGSVVGDVIGEKSVWTKDDGLPVWLSLLVGICVIALLIVFCCCYKKCRRHKEDELVIPMNEVRVHQNNNHLYHNHI